MPISKTLNVNTLNIDGDGALDHITFQVMQTGEQAVSIRTFVDTSKDGFGTLNSDTTKKFSIDTLPQWQLSSLKFENSKLILLGTDGSQEKIALSELIPGTTNDRVAMQKQQLDREIAQNPGILGALRDDSTLDSALKATGVNANMMDGIGGLIGSKGTQMGSGGLAARGSGLSGGTADDGLGGLGTKGTGTGSSGYDLIAGARLTDPSIMGGLDKALIDAVIKRNMAAIRSAYQNELTKHPGLDGKVTIQFEIAKDGTVSSCEVVKNLESTKWNDAEAGAKVNSGICSRFMKFQFPEPKGGGIVIARYPFVFSPD